MRRFLKTFLLLWAIAVLPMQGMAAIVQATCVAPPQAMAAAQEEDQHLHGHFHEQHLPDGQDQQQELHHQHHGGHDATGNHACCTGAAAPPSFPLVPVAHRDSMRVGEFLPLSHADGVTDAPDRPPKSLFL